MRSVMMMLGGGIGVMVWPKLPLVAKVGITVGVISLAAVELNKDYWESFYSSAVHSGAAAEGDSKTANLKAAQRDLAENKPVAGATATAAVNLAEHSATAQERQAVADAASESEESLLAKLQHHKRLSAAENLRLSEIRQRRADAITAEVAAQANAAWLPFNLRLAKQMETGSAQGDLFQYFYDSATRH
jgi:hypothetical protein